VKGVGEVGAIGSPPAVINAVCDAIGVRHIEMPATPERVWRAIRAAAKA
jgi:carbon-monoxide dehydrogenase large subunit